MSLSLITDDLTVSYGGIQAVRGVSISVAKGEAIAIIGSNGAGKSTLLRALSGLVPVRSGSARLGELDLLGVSAHGRARRGLVHVPEERRIVAPLSVRDNLEIGMRARRGRGSISKEDLFERSYELFPVLRERMNQRAGSLSGGQQQMLAIARGLMGEPEVLMLDEPSLGLAPSIIDEVFDALHELHESGMTVVLVEQDASRALDLSDRYYLLRQGKVVQEGESAKAAADGISVEAYVGDG